MLQKNNLNLYNCNFMYLVFSENQFSIYRPNEVRSDKLALDSRCRNRWQLMKISFKGYELG